MNQPTNTTNQLEDQPRRSAERAGKMTTLTQVDLEGFAKLSIPAELLDLAGVVRVTDSEARTTYGIKGSGNMAGIAFPYFEPETMSNGRRRTSVRIRRDHPELEDGKAKRKYVAPYGDRKRLYFPPTPELFADTTVPIVLVEAEKSSLALTAWAARTNRKILPIAMGGCYGWIGKTGIKETPTGERVPETGAIRDLNICREGRCTYVLLDANCANNPKVLAARSQLVRQLRKQGAHVHVLDLPAREGCNGPDDYIGIAGDGAMAAVLDAACATSEGGQKLRPGAAKDRVIAKRSAQRLLLELGNDIEFFHTPDRDAFASVCVNRHSETFRVASLDFALVLRQLYFRRTSSAPPKHALEDAINVFTSRALFEGGQHPVFLRLAEHNGKVYLDLGSDEWNAVEISTSGWRLIANPPVKFVRSRGMRPLPNPVVGGDVNQLRSFLNVSDEEWPLVLTWILAAFRRRGPFPILTLNGEQGSCKSSTSAVLRNLVDPNAAPLRSGPRDERDLFIAANNSWVITLDNLSHLPGWLSDALCRLATGGGLATRQLYTDLNETIINVQRPIVLNGIAELATRGDLLDRSIVVLLPNLDAEKRRDEAEFWSEFESAKPKILGALLGALAASLTQLPNARLVRKPRMADFALFGVAVERALGWSPGKFINAYEANRGGANSSALEASPVALAVQSLVQDHMFEGTATELLDELSSYVDERIKNHRGWPDSGWRLSCILRRLAPNLRASGVDVTFGDRTPDQKRARIINIRSTASDASGSSPNMERQPEKQTQLVASALALK